MGVKDPLTTEDGLISVSYREGNITSRTVNVSLPYVPLPASKPVGIRFWLFGRYFAGLKILIYRCVVNGVHQSLLLEEKVARRKP